jgi:hypothetical protein
MEHRRKASNSSDAASGAGVQMLLVSITTLISSVSVIDTLARAWVYVSKQMH